MDKLKKLDWDKIELSDTIKPCVGCGFCCSKAMCSVGRRVYGNAVEYCPALTWNPSTERHFCALAKLPGDLGAQYRKELHIGAGCCANLNSWRKTRIVDRSFAAYNEAKMRNKKLTNPIPSEFQVFFDQLGREFISRDAIVLTISATTRRLVDELEWDPQRAENWGTMILHHVTQSKTKFMEGFMG